MNIISFQNKSLWRLEDIPLDKGYYIAGFADGEASFNTSFRLRDDYKSGWKITPVFNISQKEKTVLEIAKHFMGCGTIRFRNDNVFFFFF
jgi:hypothetical protein